MFDVGFTELMLIGIVALVVIGPERLPGVARTAGKYFGRLKRFMTTIKADVEQELRADELRAILADQQKELNTLKDSISGAGKEFEKDIGAVTEAADSLAQDLDDTPAKSEAVAAPEPESTDNSVAESVPAPDPVEAAPVSKAKS
jgi:sec-independent protein translocase protein TatB